MIEFKSKKESHDDVNDAERETDENDAINMSAMMKKTTRCFLHE